MTGPRTTIPFPQVNIPASVKKQKDHLVWERGDRFYRPSDSTLTSFAKLADADDDAILAFAQRRGILNVFPVKEDSSAKSIVLPDGSFWAVSDQLYESGRVSFAPWRHLASRLRAMLRINAALKGRSRGLPAPSIGNEEDWRTLSVLENPLPDVMDAQFFLMLEVNDWLEVGTVRMALSIVGWSEKRTDWRLETRYAGLFGALAYRLLLVVAGESRLYACSACMEPYVRTSRLPRPGQENFCPDCSDVAAKRATQRYREKLKPREPS